ncbi:phosphotransferase [candidate division WWE3 bacterium]|nr:phosphotransferase [candidate division WWE3 bacterium]
MFIVEDEGAKYIIKEIDSNFGQEQALFASKINNFLYESNIPTAKVISNNDSDLIAFHNERSVQVQEYVNGDIYLDHECPKWLMKESAEYLAKINSALDNWEGEKIPEDRRFLVEFEKEKYIEKFEALISDAEKLDEGDKYKPKILKDLKYKLSLIENFKNINASLDVFTYKNTHGDYNSRQFLCGKDHIQAIIDWDRVSNMAAIIELFRSYYQEDPETKNNRVNIENLKEYIKTYTQFVPLGKEELEIMPFLHFKKLLRSSFGYKQYLAGGVRYVEDYIRYGFWRTDTVKYLAENYEKIGASIKELGK